jgi:hypothetical protein
MIASPVILSRGKATVKDHTTVSAMTQQKGIPNLPSRNELLASAIGPPAEVKVPHAGFATTQDGITLKVQFPGAVSFQGRIGSANRRYRAERIDIIWTSYPSK